MLLHLIRPVRGWGVGPRRVGGRVEQIKADLIDQLQGAAELGVGFAREAHDCVSADGGIGHQLADLLDDAAVAGGGVTPRHGLEQLVVAALEGHMEVLTHLRQLGAGFDQALGEIARVAGGEANPLDALHVVHVVQQIGEGVLAPALGRDARQITAVGINVLAQEGDFFVAAGCQPLHLQANRFRQA